MAVPVERIRVSTLHLGVHGVAGQTVLPEDALLELLEVGLVPYIGVQFAPAFAPRMEVGLVDGESLRIGLRYELRLTGNGGDVCRVDRLAQTHIVVTANRVAIGLVVDVVANLEVHAAPHVFYYKSVAAWLGSLEVDIPHIGADEGFAAGLFLRCRGWHPKLDGAHLLLALGVDVVQPHTFTLQRFVVALSAIAKPLVEVGSMLALLGVVADDVDVNSLRLRVPDVETH